MDHYKVLGLRRSATKEEIKEAFRKLAMKYHPDKHSGSSKAARDDATLRFKRLSEAYEVLTDDRKRADYNLRSSSGNYYGEAGGASTSAGYGHGYGHYRGDYTRGNDYSYARASGEGVGGLSSKLEAALRFMTTRAFLLNVAFAGTLLGAAVVIDRGREALWKMQNSGMSLDDSTRLAFVVESVLTCHSSSASASQMTAIVNMEVKHAEWMQIMCPLFNVDEII